MPARPEARVHALLGMHRSGTSWLAGSLEERGLPLGEVNTSAPHNAKGNRENPELQAVHSMVMKDSHGSWRNPPKQIVWTDASRNALREFVDSMSAQYPQWGFKDPRTVLVLDEWERQVPGLEPIGIFRHPEAVARSLAKRDFSPVDRRQSLKLWRIYNTHLIAAHKRRPFPIIHFDTGRADLVRDVDTVATSWGLPGADGSQPFFEQGLVHERAGEESVPMSCRRIWKYLVENAAQGAQRS